MQILIANIVAIVVIVATASASAEEPVMGPRRAAQASGEGEGTHLRARASGGKTTTGAINGETRGLRKRKNRGKGGKSGKGGAKSGKGGGGAKSGKGGGLPGGERPCGSTCTTSDTCPSGMTCDTDSGCCRSCVGKNPCNVNYPDLPYSEDFGCTKDEICVESEALSLGFGCCERKGDGGGLFGGGFVDPNNHFAEICSYHQVKACSSYDPCPGGADCSAPYSTPFGYGCCKDGIF